MNPLKKIKNIYHNSPLLIKLNTLILAITVLLCASLLAFVFVFYHFMVSRRNEQSVEASVERAAYSLNQSYQDILQHLSASAVTWIFRQRFRQSPTIRPMSICTGRISRP